MSIGYMSVDVLYETPDYGEESTEIYLIRGFLTAHPHLRGANVAMAIRDEDGNVKETRTIQKLGELSPAMKQAMEIQFGPDDPEAQPA